MTGLFSAEVRRVLSRRLVWTLVAMAVAGSVIAGVVSFVSTSGDPAHSAPRLTDLWEGGTEGGLLLPAIALLALGALLGGASMIGAEWRNGTMAGVLWWEPRRGRVAMAKLGASATVAVVLAAALLLVFVLALIPTLVLHGTAQGTDAAWWFDVVSGAGRGLVLVALVAVLGGAVTLAARNTAFVLGGAFIYLNIIERALVAWKPRLATWALIENIGVFLPWAPLDDVRHAPAPVAAAIHLLVVVTAITLVATRSFLRRDVALSS
jgi:ABC-2 type transport system permease protein